MLISSWNVNSVRARIDNIKSYLVKYKPDILLMQEIKTEEVNFPFDVFSSLDYESHVHGQKSYNGVAIISKKKLDNVKTDIIKDKLKQSRIISAEVEHKKKKIQLINIYTPNGNPVDTPKYEYKKNWLDDLIKKLKSLSKTNKNIILAGDFNVIPAAEDVYNPKSFEDDALYRLEIRKKYREMLGLGFSDVYRVSDVELEFDFEKVKLKSKDNPLYYVQYSYARICSIFSNSKTPINNDYKNLDKNFEFNNEEIKIIRKLSEWPKCIETSINKLEPHRLTTYLYQLASIFHSYWNMGRDSEDFRFLDKDKKIDTNKAVLLNCILLVIKNGMEIIGVDTPENM